MKNFIKIVEGERGVYPGLMYRSFPWLRTADPWGICDAAYREHNLIGVHLMPLTTQYICR